MTPPNIELGRLVSAHRLAPEQMQRAVFVAVLSFLFFLATMFGFYIRQNFIYFLLSTSFLLVYLVTMFSFVMQRRNVVKLYENGIEFRKFACTWQDLSSAERTAGRTSTTLTIKTKEGGQVVIPSTIQGFEDIERHIRIRISE